MKMTLQKIERLINTALRSLRNCIWDHPECYWPQEEYIRIRYPSETSPFISHTHFWQMGGSCFLKHLFQIELTGELTYLG